MEDGLIERFDKLKAENELLEKQIRDSLRSLHKTTDELLSQATPEVISGISGSIDSSPRPGDALGVSTASQSHIDSTISDSIAITSKSLTQVYENPMLSLVFDPSLLSKMYSLQQRVFRGLSFADEQAARHNRNLLACHTAHSNILAMLQAMDDEGVAMLEEEVAKRSSEIEKLESSITSLKISNKDFSTAISALREEETKQCLRLAALRERLGTVIMSVSDSEAETSLRENIQQEIERIGAECKAIDDENKELKMALHKTQKELQDVIISLQKQDEALRIGEEK
ncbi:hypothetical protein ADUPG1_009435 [Aduncisulcus paluster]|uniref:Uncharacterized protein n=1 Tax=Aduncisulcus paluster TaxID=2918883 RepID=A0ABQ5KVJ5_9EUKA|nr:hypothetical protein ADUPG1_009435 [Aduncisulcus paluster]